MHLGILAPEWFKREGIGGIGTYVHILVKEALRQGHKITVVAASTTQGQRYTESPKGTELVLSVINIKGLLGWAVAEAFADEVRSLAMMGIRPDIWEVPEYGGVGAIVCQSERVTSRLHTPLKFILLRNQNQSIYRDDVQRCEMEEYQVKRSVLVSSPTVWMAGECQKLWNLANRPYIVPNPCQPVWKPKRHQSTATSPLQILYFGRLEYRKGVFALAEAIEQLSERTAHYRMTFVGSDTKWKGESVRDALQRTLVKGKASCEFVPFQLYEQLAIHLRRADVVVLPSLFENFSYACIEAMSFRKPVVVTSGSGFQEIVTHNQTGFIVSPGCSDSLANLLFSLRSERRHLRHIGENGRSEIRRFAARLTVRNLIKLYEGREHSYR